MSENNEGSRTTGGGGDAARDAQLRAIAAVELGFPTLETRGHDSLDFREVSVWGVKQALERAYEAGRAAAAAETHRR